MRALARSLALPLALSLVTAPLAAQETPAPDMAAEAPAPDLAATAPAAPAPAPAAAPRQKLSFAEKTTAIVGAAAAAAVAFKGLSALFRSGKPAAVTAPDAAAPAVPQL